MKNRGILGFFAAIAMMFENEKHPGNNSDLISDLVPAKISPSEKKATDNLPKGHQYFEVDGKMVPALNMRNAVRKARKG